MPRSAKCKKDEVQKVVIPKGMINPNEITIIEIPAGLKKQPVLIARKRSDSTDGYPVVHMSRVLASSSQQNPKKHNRKTKKDFIDDDESVEDILLNNHPQQRPDIYFRSEYRTPSQQCSTIHRTPSQCSKIHRRSKRKEIIVIAADDFNEDTASGNQPPGAQVIYSRPEYGRQNLKKDNRIKKKDLNFSDDESIDNTTCDNQQPAPTVLYNQNQSCSNRPNSEINTSKLSQPASRQPNQEDLNATEAQEMETVRRYLEEFHMARRRLLENTCFNPEDRNQFPVGVPPASLCRSTRRSLIETEREPEPEPPPKPKPEPLPRPEPLPKPGTCTGTCKRM